MADLFLIVVFLYLFMYLQLNEWLKALILLAGIAAAFLSLAGTASLLMWLVKKYFLLLELRLAAGAFKFIQAK